MENSSLTKRTVNKTSNHAFDEKSTELDESIDSDNQTSQPSTKYPPTMESLKEMSRRFHKHVPKNPFFHEKIPYKTIIMVSLSHK